MYVLYTTNFKKKTPPLHGPLFNASILVVTYLWTTSQEQGVVKNAVDLLLQKNDQNKEQQDEQGKISIKINGEDTL
jgi:hypothetical protein